MSKSRVNMFIIIGAIGLIVLACIDWLIVIGVLFIAFIVWIASFNINKEESRYASSYFTSKQDVKEAKTPIGYGASTHESSLFENVVEVDFDN